MRPTYLAGEGPVGLIEMYGADTGPNRSWTFPISLSLLSQARVPNLTKRDSSHFTIRLWLLERWRTLPSLRKMSTSLPPSTIREDSIIFKRRYPCRSSSKPFAILQMKVDITNVITLARGTRTRNVFFDFSLSYF
jgi:hypothetical protein